MRALAVAIGVLVATPTADAFVPRGATAIRDTLTALPAAHAEPLRTHVEVAYGARTTPAWQRFRQLAPGAWDISYDAATGVPSRIWGAGIPAPGASASPAIAEAFARRVLADHVALLAPGARASDFDLVANHWDGSIRSIGFVQRAGGLRVLGGQVSFRFKRDRLFVIGSEALPNVAVPPSTARVDRAMFVQRATANVRAAVALSSAPFAIETEDVIVPFVGDAGVIGYRRATPTTIDGGAAGRYAAYVDPASGEVLAARQLNLYATGTVQYRGVDRYPGRARVDRPAPLAHELFGATPATTTVDGAVSWSPDAQTTVTLNVAGDRVSVVDKTATDSKPATIDLAIAPGGTVTWDGSADPATDAQLITYLSINRVKDYVRANVDAGVPGLDDALVANTNIADNCNAFFDGKAVNFFHATPQCENTGRIEDVVFHEFGHDVHMAEIIPGVGSYEPGMGEGAADTLAANVTGDSGMGRGFFYNDMPLRELDPTDHEWIYPRDVGEVHATGMIYGGAMWDLRKAMIAKYGESAGIAKELAIYVGTLRRATSIPTTLIEALATDDDDGDLSNGTPDECEIRAVWGHHGMRTTTGTMTAPAILNAHALATTVTIDVTGGSTRCTGDALAGATIAWHPSFTNQPSPGSATATATSDHSFYGPLALALDEDVYYQAIVTYTDGTTLVIPDNFADPTYQTYQGKTIPLYCTTFDTDPFADGWTTATRDGSPSPWQWVAVSGTGVTDPPAAFTGTHALVQAPGGDYPAMSYSKVELPEIDVGAYSDVRLQYRRWLAVEDSHFDQAQVTANGNRAWVNATQNNGDSSSLAHVDKEWRFHDVPLSGYFSGHTLKVGFDLTSDPGLQFGGWAIDDLCVVANAKALCGDGVRTPTEQCDSGAANADVPNQCRTYCRLPACGDAIVDDGEACDDGPTGSKTCSMKCTAIPNDDTGFCATGGGGGSLVLVLGALAIARRRQGHGSKIAPVGDGTVGTPSRR